MIGFPETISFLELFRVQNIKNQRLIRKGRGEGISLICKQ